ncbi:hypothetical protein A3K55_02300 [Candidatus Shapirobacteria bacterium RBG_13_44_7]|uniref:Fimbrial assembly protein n=1 Tax=Candidatus Shapirobacteria bacterium RBG_13_44_7 TaxID=1802149 RepID=A0A1F7SL70_9BACT|nr:MAG: hypothetical protein A3K55_02300 [Candidatus Shapirobacteria bacterium RBG_13_44_7]
MPVKREPSLLPDAENANSLFARILRWTTTVGRFTIVFTELIVICAFLSRFWLDRKNSDLSDVIRQQKAILESTQDFEKEFLLLQQRLIAVKELYSVNPGYGSKIKSLVESTPPDIIYNLLSLRQNSDDNLIITDIDLVSYKEESIIDFITNLVINPEIDTVAVNKIEKRPRDSRYLVQVSLVFKKSL